MRTGISIILLVASSLSVFACLPVDTRPEPAKVLVDVDLPSDLRASQVTPNQLTFLTEDGWNVVLDRFLVSMGDMMLDGKDCNTYSEAWYGRILDPMQPGPQRLGQVWGLNDCYMTYQTIIPAENAVLGAGVTEADRSLMNHALVPVGTPTGPSTVEGMTMHVQGTATKDTVQVRFDWGFHNRLFWGHCGRLVDGKFETALHLVSGQTTNVTIRIDPRNLFQVMPWVGGEPPLSTDTSQPLMQLIADADQVQGNANGRVAVDELAKAQFSVGDRTVNLAEAIWVFSYPSVFVYGNASDDKCRLGGDREGNGI